MHINSLLFVCLLALTACGGGADAKNESKPAITGMQLPDRIITVTAN